MPDARPVRVARTPGKLSPRAVRLAAAPTRQPIPADTGPREWRPNGAATRRAVRLSVLYAAAIAAVYAGLAGLALSGPTGATVGTSEDLLLAGGLAAMLAAAGVVVSLGSAPRGVELSDAETVIVGRFGHRYRFPGRGQIRPTVLQRFPAGWLAPAALETVEIAGGTTRRSFLLEEHLLEPEGTLPASGSFETL